MSEETVPLTNERGETRSYETVASRLARFRGAHPDWSVIPELLVVNDEVVRMKVTIGYYTDGGTLVVLSVGHAEEYRADGQINATSALENCETSALGRALAFAGFASANSIASAEEVAGAKRKQAENEATKPGALILIQNAAKRGMHELEQAWKTQLSDAERNACRGNLARLKKEAAKVDSERSSD